VWPICFGEFLIHAHRLEAYTFRGTPPFVLSLRKIAFLALRGYSAAFVATLSINEPGSSCNL
jgi:hypothetical protein